MELRAFPVLYADDVESVAAFYGLLGFGERVRVPGPDGEIGYIGLVRDGAELAVTTVDAPRVLAGIVPAPGPRHELFVYVESLESTVDQLRAHATVVREPAKMPWGERVAYLTDPEGNVVTLGQAS
jgi:lactoylglutathione lyase